MPKTFATLVDEIEQELQDSSNTVWTAAELGIQLEDAIREISEFAPYVVREVYEFETRTGTASSTTAGALVDATEAQFRSTDVDKVIFNTTDRTWAVVTAFVSTSQLTLSNDIMVSGEHYKMFNQDCESNRQIYIGDVEDYIGDDHGVEQVEYPIGNVNRAYRSFTVDRNVLTVGYDGGLPDSKDTAANVEVYVYFRRRHQVSQLTDLVGAVDLVAGYAAGLSTIHVDSLAAVEVIAEDQEFTIAGLRGVYRTTQATTLSSNEGDITFYPPLESAIADNDVVTFLGSSLNRNQEWVVVELAAGRAAESKGATYLQSAALGVTAIGKSAAETALANTALDSANAIQNTVTVGGPNAISGYTSEAAQRIATAQSYLTEGATDLAMVEISAVFSGWGRRKAAEALRSLQRGRPPVQRVRYGRY